MLRHAEDLDEGSSAAVVSRVEGMSQPERSSQGADIDWAEPDQTGSGFDVALSDLAAVERRAEAERRMRFRAACEFLAAFYKSDVESAKTLTAQGITTGFAGNRIAFAKAGRPAEVAISVSSEGWLVVLFAPGGRRDLIQRTDVGEFDPMIKSALRKQMIRFVIGYLGVDG